MNCVYCTQAHQNIVSSANEHKFRAFVPHSLFHVVDGNGDIDDDDDGLANNDDDDDDEQQFHDIMMYS